MTEETAGKQPTLPAFEIESLKAFRDRSRLELAPITLLYGRNQAGKSTLLRLLALIADSTFGAAPVMDLSSPALAGSSFKELGWLGPEPSASPIMRVENQATKDYLEIQYTDDRGVVPNRIDIGTGVNSDFAVSAGSSIRTSDEYRAPYEGTYGHKPWSGDWPSSLYCPLGPRSTPRGASLILRQLLNLCEDCSGYLAQRSWTLG